MVVIICVLVVVGILEYCAFRHVCNKYNDLAEDYIKLHRLYADELRSNFLMRTNYARQYTAVKN